MTELARLGAPPPGAPGCEEEALLPGNGAADGGAGSRGENSFASAGGDQGSAALRAWRRLRRAAREEPLLFQTLSGAHSACSACVDAR